MNAAISSASTATGKVSHTHSTSSCGSASLPTGAGTATWYYRTNSLPAGLAGANLRIRFTSSSTVEFRLDDVLLTGDSATPSFVDGYENLAVAGTSQSVTGLTAETTYYFRVRAEGEGGCPSVDSATASVTTLETIGGPQTIDFPAIPD